MTPRLDHRLVAGLASVATLAAFAALPAPAHAGVDCTFASGSVAVDVTAGSPVIGLRRNANDIEVFDGLPGSVSPTACVGGTPTVTNTAAIEMIDNAAGQDTDFNVDIAGGPFEPGVGDEGAGTEEIEITIGGTDGIEDELTILGGTGADSWRMGALSPSASGVNLNPPEAGGADGDDIAISGVEEFQIASDGFPAFTGGDDTVDASGGAPFTGPLDLPGTDLQQMGAGPGDDVLIAGNDPVDLIGDSGDDTMTGGPAADNLRLSDGGTPGNDVATGNGGADFCSYINQGGDLTVDLRKTTPQNTGAGGLDTLSGCENLAGAPTTTC